jgi:hypothetical protein
VGGKPVLCACVLAVVLGGCGTTDRDNDAAAVAERFHAALETGDGEAACAELSPETASKLEDQEKKPCPEAVLTLDLPKGGSVADTRVYMTSAFAQLAQGGADFLDESPEGWQVSAAGCNEVEPTLPYDCELED